MRMSPMLPVGIENAMLLYTSTASRRRGLKRLVFILIVFLTASPVYAAQASTTTILSIDPSSNVAVGTVVTLTATVTNPGNVTSGTVNFCNMESTDCAPGSGLYGTAQLTSQGAASIRHIFAYGVNNIKAVFLPTTANASSTSLAETVAVMASQSYTSATALTASGSAGNYTLSGTVAAFGSEILSGPISFLDTTNSSVQIGATSLSMFSANYTLPVPYSVGSNPHSIAVGDFNGDGILDMVVANYGGDSVSVLLGNGDGTFQTQATYATGSSPYSVANPYSVAVGDFNGDGKLDIVVANSAGSSVLILRGNGDGTFQPRVSYTTGLYPSSVAVGDFNGDGKLDLIVGNAGGDTVSVLLGNGDGTFQSQVTYATGIDPFSVAVGDFNGDGKLDIVVVNSEVGTVSVLLGNGDGTFRTQVIYATGTYPSSVAVSDFNGDGKLDLVVSNEGSIYAPGSTVSVLLGNGDGTFQPQVTYGTGLFPISVAAGNLNGDGKLDIVAANYGDNTVSVLIGNGDGTFQRQTTYAVGSNPFSSAVGDFNGDGKLDIVTANESDNAVSVLLGNQTASFSESGIDVPGVGTHYVLAAYGGDGRRMSSQSPTVALTAEMVTPTVTAWPTASSLTYGQTLAWSTLYGGTASVGGTFAWTTPNTVPNLGTASQSVTFTPINTTGYNSVIGSTSVAVGKATPVLSWSTPAGISYGTALTASQLDATSGRVAGSFVYTPALGAVLAAGSQTLSVTFTPTDATDYATATTTVTLAVGKAGPTLSLTSSSNPATYGSTVTFTANYGSSATGTISFYDGATLIGSSALASGVASISLNNLSGGVHLITASYAGDSNYLSATSTSLSQSIAVSPVTGTVTSTVNPSVFGSTTTFTVTLAGLSGHAVPSGIVVFADSGQMLATLTLDASGKANYTTATLLVGSHPLTAQYGGDSNYR